MSYFPFYTLSLSLSQLFVFKMKTMLVVVMNLDKTENLQIASGFGWRLRVFMDFQHPLPKLTFLSISQVGQLTTPLSTYQLKCNDQWYFGIIVLSTIFVNHNVEPIKEIKCLSV